MAWYYRVAAAPMVLFVSPPIGTQTSNIPTGSLLSPNSCTRDTYLVLYLPYIVFVYCTSTRDLSSISPTTTASLSLSQFFFTNIHFYILFHGAHRDIFLQKKEGMPCNEKLPSFLSSCIDMLSFFSE